MATKTPTTTTTVQRPAAGSYLIEPDRSIIAFQTRHMFGLGAVNGTFAVVGGQIEVTEPLESSSVTAESTSASFTTDKPKRDAHVKSPTFLHADEHTHLTYRSTSLVHDGDSWRLQGTLTVRGQEAPLELTVEELTATDAGLTIRAAGRVDRYAHGLVKGKGMAARYLNLVINAQATRA